METFRLIIGPDDNATALQLGARAVVLFTFGILCIRIAGRRTFAQYAPLDIVVALIACSNISRVMTGKAAFFPALGATLVLVILHRLLGHAALRWGLLSWLVKARPIKIIEDGKVDEQALRRAELSREDMLEAIRLEQVERPEDVAAASVEGSGKVSVVPKKKR